MIQRDSFLVYFTAVTSVSEERPQPSGSFPSHVHQPPGLHTSVSYSGYSNLDYGSDATYDNSVVGTPSKGSEGGFDIEMEALAIEEQSAINGATENGDKNLQQNGTHLPETARNDSEEDSVQSRRPQVEILDDVVTSSEVCYTLLKSTPLGFLLGSHLTTDIQNDFRPVGINVELVYR